MGEGEGVEGEKGGVGVEEEKRGRGRRGTPGPSSLPTHHGREPHGELLHLAATLRTCFDYHALNHSFNILFQMFQTTIPILLKTTNVAYEQYLSVKKHGKKQCPLSFRQ